MTITSQPAGTGDTRALAGGTRLRGRSIGDPADLLALRDLAQCYAAAADNLDGELFASLFAQDATLSVHYPQAPARLIEGSAAIAGVVRSLGERFAATFHFVGNHQAQVAGDTAVGEAYCLAHHLHRDADGAPADLRMAIRYADAYVRAADGTWRFQRRAVNVLWQWLSPVAASPLGPAPGPGA